jgi:hypothetical protein
MLEARPGRSAMQARADARGKEGQMREKMPGRCASHDQTVARCNTGHMRGAR